jgi:hypothetical protein
VLSRVLAEEDWLRQSLSVLLCMHVTFTFDSAAAADSTDGLPAAAVASFYSFTREAPAGILHSYYGCTVVQYGFQAVLVVTTRYGGTDLYGSRFPVLQSIWKADFILE